MSEPDYQKQAQDFYGNAPVIVMGSGASAAHGLSGMGNLANHITTQTNVLGIGNTDEDAWRQFSELLRSGVDLENALQRVALSEELTLRIIHSTWNLINAEDLKVFDDCVQNKVTLPLGRLLTHMFRSSLPAISIITTNYDRLIEYACDQQRIHHYTGFTHGFLRQLASPTELKCSRKVNIWKVHGSTDWFKSQQGEIVALSKFNNQVPENLEPQIVTPGAQKYRRTHAEPYRSIINYADIALDAAKSYLCVGYGFNDEHIQPKLMVKCLRQNVPITIVTYALSEAARKLILDANAKNYLAIERGASDDESLVYSSLDKTPFTVHKNIWSLEGYLSLII